MVKIRLARQGRKKLPIYKIVAANSRARRDGRFIESLGQYRPSNEANNKLELNEERVMHWLKVGAQPTDTVRALLSREGILLKWHLEKKQIPADRASEIFNTWKAARDSKVEQSMNEKQRAIEAKRRALEEKRAAEAKAKEDAAKAEAEAAAQAEAPAEAEAVSEAPVAEAAAE